MSVALQEKILETLADGKQRTIAELTKWIKQPQQHVHRAVTILVMRKKLQQHQNIKPRKYSLRD